MNNFLGHLIAKQLDDGYHWEMYEAFTYHLVSPDGPEFVRVPKGFVTDFASIPRGLWNLWPPAAGKHSKPAVVHDVLYQRAYVEVFDGSIRWIERKEADDIFKDAMKVAGVGWLSRRLIYRGVRLGGWKAWKRYRKAEDVDLEKAG